MFDDVMNVKARLVAMLALTRSNNSACYTVLDSVLAWSVPRTSYQWLGLCVVLSLDILSKISYSFIPTKWSG